MLEKKKHRVLSLDFDGCLFNENYMEQYQKNKKLEQIIDSNKAFFKQIKSENLNYTGVTLMVGSNRQSYRIDTLNINDRRPSCFPSIKIIEKHLNEGENLPKVMLSQFLMADLHHDLQDGISFQLAIETSAKLQKINDGNYQEKYRIELENKSIKMDATKGTLLYAQIHKIALAHPEEDIVFDFYDDRDHILQHLVKFFSLHTNLIPKNVTLNLHLYNGGNIEQYDPLQGMGQADKHYAARMKEVTKECYPYQNDQEINFIADYFDEKKTVLDNYFKKQYENENTLHLDIEIEHKNFEEIQIISQDKSTDIFTLLNSRAQSIQERFSKKPDDQDLQNAHNAMHTLMENLKQLNINDEKIISQVMQKIQTSYPILSQNRNGNYIAANILICVLSLIIFYPIVLAVNYYQEKKRCDALNIKIKCHLDKLSILKDDIQDKQESENIKNAKTNPWQLFQPHVVPFGKPKTALAMEETVEKLIGMQPSK